MSEVDQTKSIVDRFSEALGCKPIYVGKINPLDALTDALQARIRVAKRAREIAAESAETPTHLALRGLTQIVDGDIGVGLDREHEGSRDTLASLISRLTVFHDQRAPEDTSG